MSFLESQFPTDVSYGSSGGPSYLTSIVTTKAGYEARNVEWSLPRHKYNAAMGIQSLADLDDVIRFFHACQGSGYGFRLKDWADFKSCLVSATPAATDQNIGTGTGALATFQLRKAYTVGSQTLYRTITKPVAGTVKVAVDGVEKTITTDFTVNTATGLVTFEAGKAPALNKPVTAGFEFDTPTRFDVDELVLTHEAFQSGGLNIPLIEVRV